METQRLHLCPSSGDHFLSETAVYSCRNSQLAATRLDSKDYTSKFFALVTGHSLFRSCHFHLLTLPQGSCGSRGDQRSKSCTLPLLCGPWLRRDPCQTLISAEPILHWLHCKTTNTIPASPAPAPAPAPPPVHPCL